MTRRRPCRICPDECSPELHAAHDSLRAWLRARINAYLEPVVIGPKGHRVQNPICAVGLVPRLIPEHDAT